MTKFSFYTKKDGSFIIYANGDNGCSIATDNNGFPAEYSKYMTQGKRNLRSKAISELMGMNVEQGVDVDNFAGRILETPYGVFAEKLEDSGKYVVRVA